MAYVYENIHICILTSTLLIKMCFHVRFANKLWRHLFITFPGVYFITFLYYMYFSIMVVYLIKRHICSLHHFEEFFNLQLQLLKRQEVVEGFLPEINTFFCFVFLMKMYRLVE